MTHVIHFNWPECHKFSGSENFIKALIEKNPSLGVFSKSNNELRAWVLVNEFDALACLQTIDEHKKKGYASLLVKEMAKQRANSGIDTVAAILLENLESIHMFKKIGFFKVHNLRCVLFSPLDYSLEQ